MSQQALMAAVETTKCLIKEHYPSADVHYALAPDVNSSRTLSQLHVYLENPPKGFAEYLDSLCLTTWQHFEIIDHPHKKVA